MKASIKVMLKPTTEQVQRFMNFAGGARFAYNACLEYRKSRYENYGESTTVQQCIEYIRDLKYGSCPWLCDIPEAITKQAIKDLDKAYKNFFKGIGGYPNYKSKRNSRLSFYQRTDSFRFVTVMGIYKCKISGIEGYVQVSNHLSETEIEILSGKVENPRVSFDGKYWYLSVSAEFGDCSEEGSIHSEIIGVDLGIKNLATLSTGEKYENVNYSEKVKHLEREKRYLQRAISRKYEANRDGSKYVKTKNIIKLEKRLRLINRRLKNIRITHIHNITSELVSRAKVLCIEDLNVKGMLKNRYLAKSISDCEFYEFRRQLEYKCKFYGVRLVVADRFYPSTKIIHCHGYKLPYISLCQREVTCPICGQSYDRDVNAAINLMRLA